MYLSYLKTEHLMKQTRKQKSQFRISKNQTLRSFWRLFIAIWSQILAGYMLYGNIRMQRFPRSGALNSDALLLCGCPKLYNLTQVYPGPQECRQKNFDRYLVPFKGWPICAIYGPDDPHPTIQGSPILCMVESL